MRVPFFYKKTAVVMAIVVIVLSTATLSYLSYRYTVGGENSLERALVQQNILQVEQTVDRIEKMVLANDRILYDLVDVSEPSKWPAISEAIKKNPELNVDRVWFLRPDGTVLYPPVTRAAFEKIFKLKDFHLDTLRLDETNNLQKGRESNFSFASHARRKKQKREEILVCYQMNKDRIIS